MATIAFPHFSPCEREPAEEPAVSAVHTITSREFGHNVSSAKHLARQGPVFITDRGEPAFVLLNIDQYQSLAGGEREQSLLALMDGLPDTSGIDDFEIEPLGVGLHTEG